jgi:AraC-like DNA-binding protein
MVLQNNKLRTAYKNLFDKNVKLVEVQKHLPKTYSERYQTSTLTDETQSELLARIYTVMEDTSMICDAEFSLDKLADLVESNRVYISQVINDGLKKNFRAFINEYRIREAQRLFSETDTSKYTIDFIAHTTGFKSRTSFISAFKEATGVTPGFYLKALQER